VYAHIYTRTHKYTQRISDAHPTGVAILTGTYKGLYTLAGVSHVNKDGTYYQWLHIQQGQHTFFRGCTHNQGLHTQSGTAHTKRGSIYLQVLTGAA